MPSCVLAKLSNILQPAVAFTSLLDYPSLMDMEKKSVIIGGITGSIVGLFLLVTAVAIPSVGKKGYSKSQASSQAISCGNGEISIANFCREIGVQNQGKENSAAQSGNQEINVDLDLGRE